MRLKLAAWKYVLIAGLGSIAVYFVLPLTGKDVAYSVLGSASVICILIGIRINRPSDRLGWYFLAIAGACFTLGDDAWSYYNVVLHSTVPFPSFADALYLSGYPFLFAGVLRLTRNQNRSARREDNADAAVVALGALAISWHFLMNSYVHDSTLGTFGMVVNLAYPIMDIALVFIVFRALVFGDSRTTSHKLLAAAMTVMFIGDFTYDLLVLHNSYQTGNACDALFLVEYVAVAVAALHPSVADTCAPENATSKDRARRELSTRRRIPIVMLAGFIPPTILIATALLGISVNVLVMAVLCFAVFAVICLRLTWLIDRITRQAQAMNETEAQLRYQAFHDELTGLANRALLYDRIEQALVSVGRTGKSVALCFGDLDGFKTINDTLGHDVGYQVLVTVGTMLQSIVRPGDTVARLGGDEFAILMVDLENPGVAVDFGNRVISSLVGAAEVDEYLAGVSISVGVSFADSTTPADQLISEADSAMYEAKSNGKNRVEVFQPAMRSRLVDRLEITSGFRGSLQRSEFFLEYQPIYSLADRTVVGFEALVRWRHPTLGLVAPLDFIPIAEETGFIVPLGRWVLMEACEQLAILSQPLTAHVVVSINVSRRQLIVPHFVDDVRAALALSGLGPRQLVVEVTEGILMENPDKAVAALAELQQLGVRIAVDDFGTGYSSLSHLQRFPVDILKIDKSFVGPLNHVEPETSALVSSIIGLAHSLGLQVVAEGIEREDQLDVLLERGCKYGQGYLMSRPLDQSAASDLISTINVSGSQKWASPIAPS